MTKNLPTLLLLSALVTIVTGLFSFDAYAATSDCGSAEGNLNTVFCGIVEQFSSVPKLLSMISWVIAVVLAIIGLVNLKEYGDDPSRMPLKNIIVKFIIAVTLVSLPFVMQVVSGSFTTNYVNPIALNKRPVIGRGNIGGKH